MAKLDEYWSQIQQSESFKDLDDPQKEKVRSHLFDRYIQTSDSYLRLPQSQRIKVKTHFDDITKIQPEGTMARIERKAKPVIQKGKELAREYAPVDVTKLPGELQQMASTGEEIPGAKKAAGMVAGEAEKAATAIEPNYIKPSLTDFDVARAIGAGAVRTAGEFISGLIPETTFGAAAFFADPVLKYAGTTFLGRELHFPGWKPKTGLATPAGSPEESLGDAFEKIVTKRRIENNSRKMTEGPPKPLEVLAHKEETLKTQDDLQQYEEWLKQADSTSDRGGEQGDLYPEAKVNVSQLRDAAKERLQKLKDEPARVESLSRAEDELQGYYRRRIDQAKVYMMPAGNVPRGKMLSEGPQPAGLLGPGSKPLPDRPAPKAPTPARKPAASPADTSVQPTLKAKDVLSKMYSAYYPEESKQAIGIRAGTSLKAFGFKGNEELGEDHLNLLERLVGQEHADYLAQEAKTKARTGDAARLKEKGLDPLEVKAEAQRLKEEHEMTRQSNLEAKSQLKQVTGGIGFHDPDPMTGKIPEAEEVLRNVPMSLRGPTKPDQAAQMAYDAGLIPGPSTSDLYKHTKSLESGERPRSAKSFLDEAEYRLDNQNHIQAGFKPKPKQETLPGTPPAAMPVSGLSKTEGQVPEEGLLEGFQNRDNEQRSMFDIVSELGKHLGEKGQIGGDIDPVRQAALEASIKELVDRAMAIGYQTTQDIMMYAARNAPKELQDAIRKNLAPTLSPFDDHAYREMEQAKQGNAAAKKSIMDDAQRGYFQKKLDIVKGTYRKFKANQQITAFKDADEGKMRLINDLFIHDNYRNFSKDELAAQRWYTEGKSPKLESLTALGMPEETAKQRLELAKKPTDLMKKARPMTQVFEDEYHDLLSEFYDQVGYREDHVTRRWKRPEEYMDWEGRTLSNRPNFLKGAKLLSQAQGIDAGLEPESFDIRDDLRASNNARVNVLSRIHAYQKLGASFGPDGLPAIMDESGDVLTQSKNAKITPHQGQAPGGWMRFDHVPLLKGLAINPYYKPAMKFLLARPFQGTTPEVLDFLAASTKATKLIGFFHGYTLGEMTLSGISYRDVFSFGKNRNPLFRGLRYFVKGMTADMEGRPLSKNPARAVGELYRSFMTGHAVLANRPFALDMAEHGFKFGSADEDMHGILRKFLNKTETYLAKRIGENPAKVLTALPRGAVDIQEKFLWSYIRPISSMLVYETNLKDAILKFNLEAEEGKKIPVDQIKSMIVNQTSKGMGGISYARLMIHPKTQQVLQWAMLAPGWTIGRVLMGASVFQKGPEGRQARTQMLKLFTAWFFASNMINYHQTEKYFGKGKGRYMWDNPEGYRNQAFLSKEKDGSTRYLQLSKALTEIYDDVMYPAKTAAYKLSGPVQAAVKVINWATAKAYYPGVSPENPAQALLHAYEPMVSSGQSAYGGFPIRRGPSRNKVEGMLQEYHRTGNAALFQEAMQTATEQGYDLGKLDRFVRSNERSRERRALLK